MAVLPTYEQAVERFGLNENRLNDFLNQDGYYLTNETTPRQVETIPALMQRLYTRYLNIVDQGDWATGTVYAINDAVKQGGILYLCTTGHTSGVFATDLAANRWVIYQGLVLTDITSDSVGKGADLVGYNGGTVKDTLDTLLAADLATVQATQAEMEAGTESALRSMSPLLVSQAIAAQIPLALTSGVVVPTTSGAYIDFVSIPAGVKEITIQLYEVSFNGVSGNLYLRLGDSGGVEETGYNSKDGSNQTLWVVGGTTLGTGSYQSGIITLRLLDASTNTWAFSAIIDDSGPPGSTNTKSGSKSLSATLDRIRLGTSSGAFDSGKVNILYM